MFCLKGAPRWKNLLVGVIGQGLPGVECNLFRGWPQLSPLLLWGLHSYSLHTPTRALPAASTQALLPSSHLSHFPSGIQRCPYPVHLHISVNCTNTPWVFMSQGWWLLYNHWSPSVPPIEDVKSKRNETLTDLVVAHAHAYTFFFFHTFLWGWNWHGINGLSQHYWIGHNSSQK